MNSINDIWAEVIKALSGKMTQTAIKTWFDGCVPIEIDNCRLVIHTDNSFKRDIIVSRYAQTIKDVLSDLFSCDFDLLVLAGDEIDDYVVGAKQEDDNSLPEMAGYTFDRFIVGKSNEFAHAAAKAVAANPGSNVNNPLFIYGNSGLGKTHLLFAIGQSIKENFPGTKIAYVKGDDFTNEMVASIKTGKQEEFRMKYRDVDLFLVDDIQFIAGKQQTQNEFFNTFNNIYEGNHQIVITSDRPPREMSLLDDRLRSRFEGGLMADIQPPDIETRMAITSNKASQLGLVLPDKTVAYIAENVTANIRQIEGVIKRLTAYKEILNTTITPEYVEKAIADVTRLGSYIPSPEIIIRETANYYGISAEDITGQNRSKKPAIARQVAMYLMRNLTNLSLKDIGSSFGDRNHATVLASIKKIEEYIATDPNMAPTIRDITSNINSN